MFRNIQNKNKTIIIVPKNFDKPKPINNNIKVNHKTNDYDNIRKIVEENENPVKVNENKNVKKSSIMNNIV